jgi:hypothetical protein
MLSVELGTRQSARFAGQNCVASKVLSRLWRSFDGLLVDIADWFELVATHQQGRIQVDGAPGVCARLRRGHSDCWIALDVTRSACLDSTDNYDARLLSLESPTPRARTYADRLSESSREVTLVAETARRGHIR